MMSKSYYYSVFGLTIKSALYLPELVPSSGRAEDVVIRRESLTWQPPAGDMSGRYLCMTTDGVYLNWDSVGNFLVRNGNEIIISPHSDVAEAIIRLPLLGLVFAVLLHQRGILALHGSVVASNGQAIAFLGHKGHGKSTMAATMRRHGYQLLSDDTVALDMQSPERTVVLPAFPSQKLWPDALTALGENPEELDRIYEAIEKRHVRLSEPYLHQSVPFSAIYLLGMGTEPEIVLLTPQEAMIQLLPQLSVAPFGNQLLQTRDTSHFLQCAELSRRVPVYQLKRPRNLDLLDDLAQMITAHAQVSSELEVMKSPYGN